MALALGLLSSLAVTLAVELTVAFVLGWRVGRELRIVALVNLVTNPLLNVVLALVWATARTAYWPAVVVGEIAVVIVEWRFLMRLTGRSSAGSLRLSVTMNAASLAVGLLLWLLLRLL